MEKESVKTSPLPSNGKTSDTAIATTHNAPSAPPALSAVAFDASMITAQNFASLGDEVGAMNSIPLDLVALRNKKLAEVGKVFRELLRRKVGLK